MQFDFRTVVDPGEFDEKIDVGSPVFLVGSCFADNIGHKIQESRLHSLINPFGVLYNPVSIAKVINRTINRRFCEKDELMFHHDLWHHFEFHGRFNNDSQDLVCEAINQEIEAAGAFLKDAEFLIITFGTSYAYERKDTSEIVANCHKFPGDFFDRYMLEPEEIVSLYKELIISLRIFNPNLKVIFTVSPVRHLKDGAHGNQVSKASLILSIEKLLSLFEGVWYFPAYEIVMDELRDYRFYEPGMLNPSGQAVDYIWARFSEVLLSEHAKRYISLTKKVHLARRHRLLNTPDDAYFNFIRKNIALIEEIERQFPDGNLQDDYSYFNSL